MQGDFFNWLLDQAAALVLAVGFIWYLIDQIKRIRKEKKAETERKDEIIKEKDDKIFNLAEGSLRVATLWDARGELSTKEHKEIVVLLRELKEISNKLLIRNENKSG